jgi:hypothetical protein
MPEHLTDPEASSSQETHAPNDESSFLLSPEQALVQAASEQADSAGLDAIAAEAMAKGHIRQETGPDGKPTLQFDETGHQVWAALNERENELKAKASREQADHQHRQTMADDARDHLNQTPDAPSANEQIPSAPLTGEQASHIASALSAALKKDLLAIDKDLATKTGAGVEGELNETNTTRAEAKLAQEADKTLDSKTVVTEADLKEAYRMNKTFEAKIKAKQKKTEKPTEEQPKEITENNQENTPAETTDTSATEAADSSQEHASNESAKAIKQLEEHAKAGESTDNTITGHDGMNEQAQERRDLLNIPSQPFAIYDLDGTHARLFAVPDQPNMIVVEWVNDQNQRIGQSVLTSHNQIPTSPNFELPKDITQRLSKIRHNTLSNVPRQHRKGWRRMLGRRQPEQVG